MGGGPAENMGGVGPPNRPIKSTSMMLKSIHRHLPNGAIGEMSATLATSSRRSQPSTTATMVCMGGTMALCETNFIKGAKWPVHMPVGSSREHTHAAMMMLCTSGAVAPRMV